MFLFKTIITVNIFIENQLPKGICMMKEIVVLGADLSSLESGIRKTMQNYFGNALL